MNTYIGNNSIIIFLTILVSCSKDSNKLDVCPNNDCWVDLYTEGNNRVGDYFEVTPILSQL